MHTKVINPQLDGNKVYANTGSVNDLVEYLLHEAKENWEGEDIFFNQEEDGIYADRVRASIDNNVKGLKASEEKFYTIIISPSEDELKHIGNDDVKLKEYTRKIMDDYAKNFNFKDGTKLSSDDLLWFATIHADREFKNLDLKDDEKDGLTKKERAAIEKLREQGDAQALRSIEFIQERARRRNEVKFDKDMFKPGEKKPGLNKHIHVVVSRKDKEMRWSLNPRGRKVRFDLRKWQKSNADRFKEMFGYTKQNTYEGFYQSKKDQKYFDKKIDNTIKEINDKYLNKEKLDAQRIKDLGARHNYSRAFFINLGKLKKQYQGGKYFVDPYFFMNRGRDIKPEEYARQDFVASRDRGAVSRSTGSDQKQFEVKSAGSIKISPVVKGIIFALGQSSKSGGFVRETMYFDFEKRKRRRQQQQGDQGNSRNFDDKEIDL